MLAQPKLHLAVPCGHQSVCGACAERMLLCPYCRAPVQVWVQHRMVKTHTLELHCSVGLELWKCVCELVFIVGLCAVLVVNISRTVRSCFDEG